MEADAEEYVNSVMSSQPPAVTMRTPMPSGRKRSLSASAATTDVKKHKGDCQTVNRQTLKAKRSLLLEQPAEIDDNKAVNYGSARNSQVPASGSKETDERIAKTAKSRKAEAMTCGATDSNSDKEFRAQPSQCDSCGNDSEIKLLLRKLSDDMVAMHSALNKKIDLIENRIEQTEKKITERVTDKVTKIIDKRVNTEAARLRKEIDDKLNNLRDDFNSELVEISNRLDNERRKSASMGEEDRHLRVAVRNLPETVNEDLIQKIHAVFRDGLKINDASIVYAERKDSRNESTPGVVIAKFNSSEGKKKVMSAKNMLRDSRQYSRVYINHDMSKEERNLANNMRTLLNGVRRGQNLQVRGTRIVASNTSDRAGRHRADREDRSDGRRSTDEYRPRNADRVSENQRQGDRRNGRNEARNEGNGYRDGQRETTRHFGNTRGRNENSWGQNQRNRRH